MILEYKDVLNFLPHRDPFLFIDSVSSITFPGEETFVGIPTAKDLVGGKVVAHFYVRDDLKILEGHFPGNPILPGVVQTEMMAQASCFLNVKCVEPGKELQGIEIDVALLGVDRARYRKPITPGMKLTIYSELKKARGPFLNYSCFIQDDKKETISEADILALFKFL
jgi:3-hydroxyacyl-[acyl-carrier-protein] dehydratase